MKGCGTYGSMRARVTQMVRCGARQLTPAGGFVPASGTVRRPVTIEGEDGRVDGADNRCAEVPRAVDAVTEVHVPAPRRLLLFATQDHRAGQQPDQYRAGYVVELHGP